MADTLPARIFAALDEYDREHGTSGCPATPGGCIHSAAAALRAVLGVVEVPELRMSALQQYAVYAAAGKALGLVEGVRDV